MPPQLRMTRKMILDAAFAIARTEGIGAVNARAIAQRLGCSTQPVLYQFAHMEDVRREVYRMADEMHSAALMGATEGENPMLAIGLNYIRFAVQERHLFRLLFQSDGLGGRGIAALADAPELTPVLQVLQQQASLTQAQTRRVFMGLAMLAHGWASMLANNAMPLDEEALIPTLEMAFRGMVVAVRTEEDA